jgi:hypothetical protein
MKQPQKELTVKQQKAMRDFMGDLNVLLHYFAVSQVKRIDEQLLERIALNRDILITAFLSGETI